MIDHFKTIYRHQTDVYDRLVAREDYQGNLFAALNDIRRLDGLHVVEFGAGTGRLTRLLSVMVRQVFAFDIEYAMVAKALDVLPTTGMTNWKLAQADNRRMPLANACTDLAIEGWSFGHVTDWYPTGWRRETEKMLSEIERIVKPGGTAILIETLGTGQHKPNPPSDALRRLYDYWRDEHGFAFRWIRTDYQFASSAEANELMRAFFGCELSDRVLRTGKVIVPECTGIWWKRFA